jgi:uncharacterized protein YlzI (FlbEa/FlbD family)
MIELTLTSGEPWNVNPDHIIEVMDYREEEIPEAKAAVTTSYVTRIVQEERKEIVRKVLEWQSARDNHRAALQICDYYLAAMHEKTLQELAGLEEPTDDAG